MRIHVVAAGETLTSIATQYGVTTEQIIAVNELPNPDDLIVGQSLAIRVPQEVYTVVEGDTLASVAAKYGVSTTQIMQNNSSVAAINSLIVGQTIVISFRDDEVLDTISINGYAYPYIDRTQLRKALPFLTYLLLFTYGFTAEGTLIPIEDEELINIAKEYGVGPIMVLAPMTPEGAFNSDIAHNLFVNDAAENTLIENVITNCKTKGYRGVDIDFEFVKPEDSAEFLSFITKMQNRMSQEGLLTFVALAPKTSGEMTGLLYEAHDYPAIGAVADEVLLMTYEWGYTYAYT